MKKVAFISVLALVVCLVVAPAFASDAKKNEHEMNVSFVSCDAKAMTMTFKMDDGQSKTAPMMEKVAKSCPTMKAGTMVTLTCKDNDKGEHEAVSDMKTAMAAKEKPMH